MPKIAERAVPDQRIPKYVGLCVGGPYDGQVMEHWSSHYLINIVFSTAEPQHVSERHSISQYRDTSYSFDGTQWIWSPST